MDSLPSETIAEIIYFVVFSGTGINYNLPTVELTCRKFRAAIAAIARKYVIDITCARKWALRSLLEYYIHLGIQPNIDFAISLGASLNPIHITTCMRCGYDIMLDYILQKYGLPDPTNHIYTTALIECNSPELVAKLGTYRFEASVIFIQDSLDTISPATLRQLIIDIPNIPFTSFNPLLMTHNMAIRQVLHAKNAARLIENYKIMNKLGYLAREVYVDIIYELYKCTYYNDIYIEPAYAIFAVELYANDTTNKCYIVENIHHPEITTIFANAPHIVLIHRTNATY